MLQSLQTTSVKAPNASAHPSSHYQSAASAHPSASASAHPAASASAHPSVPYQTVKSREQQLTDQFTRRQAEYESMVKKDVPTPHFTENVKDEAILDLGSAVKEYMKQRDQDIEIPKPADSPTNALPMALQSTPTSPMHLRSAPSVPLKLNLNNTEPISLTVDELPLKKVQWGENIEHVFDKNESIAFESNILAINKNESNILAINKNESNILVKMEKDILEMKTKLEEILALLQK